MNNLEITERELSNDSSFNGIHCEREQWIVATLQGTSCPQPKTLLRRTMVVTQRNINGKSSRQPFSTMPVAGLIENTIFLYILYNISIIHQRYFQDTSFLTSDNVFLFRWIGKMITTANSSFIVNLKKSLSLICLRCLMSTRSIERRTLKCDFWSSAYITVASTTVRS
jgi:hypothetical protein